MLDPFPTALLFEKKHLFVSTLFGGVFRSADGGQTWSSMNTGLGSLHVLCMASLENTLYAGTSQGLYQSDNEGESWQSVQLPYPHAPHRIIFSLLAHDKQILAGSSGTLYLGGSKNGGWSQIVLPSLFMIQTLLPVGKSVLIGSSGDGVFISSDSNVWTKNEALNAALDNGNISALGYGSDSTVVAVNTGENSVFYAGRFLNEALPKEGFRSLTLHNKVLYGGTYSKGVWKYSVEPKEKQTVIAPTALKIASLEPTYRIFPNPTTQQFTVQYQVRTVQNVRIELYSSKGEQLYTFTDQTHTPGVYSTVPSVGNLVPGAYFCLLQLDGKIFFERLIITR